MKNTKNFGFILSTVLCFLVVVLLVIIHLTNSFRVFMDNDVVISFVNNIDTRQFLFDEDNEQTDLYYELVNEYSNKINDISFINNMLYTSSYHMMFKEVIRNKVSSVVLNEENKDVISIVDIYVDSILAEANYTHGVIDRNIIRDALIDVNIELGDNLSRATKDIMGGSKVFFSIMSIWLVIGIIIILFIMNSIMNLSINKGAFYTGVTIVVSSLIVFWLSILFRNISPDVFIARNMLLVKNTIIPAVHRAGDILFKNGLIFSIIGIGTMFVSYKFNRE